VWQGIENSPIALAFGQLTVFILSALIYGRQKSALDLEKRDRGIFGIDVKAAVQAASEAKRTVDMVEVDHYRKLATLFTCLTTEHEGCKAKIAALEESVSSLSNKLASRDRADKAVAKRTTAQSEKENEGLVPTVAGASDLDSILRAHGVPMAPVTASPEARPASFGKLAR